jgi:hypothetical protein
MEAQGEARVKNFPIGGRWEDDLLLLGSTFGGGASSGVLWSQSDFSSLGFAGFAASRSANQVA